MGQSQGQSRPETGTRSDLKERIQTQVRLELELRADLTEGGLSERPEEARRQGQVHEERTEHQREAVDPQRGDGRLDQREVQATCGRQV